MFEDTAKKKCQILGGSSRALDMYYKTLRTKFPLFWQNQTRTKIQFNWYLKHFIFSLYKKKKKHFFHVSKKNNQAFHIPVLVNMYLTQLHKRQDRGEILHIHAI